MPSILPPISLPLLIHTRPIPCPLPVRPQPTLRQPPAHSSSAPILFPFCPQPTLRPSPAHSPLSVTPRTCTSVTLSPLAYNLFTRPPVNSSTCNVTHRTCSSVTLSINTPNLLPFPLVNPSTSPVPCLLSHTTCSLVYPSTRQLTMLLIELVHLLPCLLNIQLVHPSPRPLVN